MKGIIIRRNSITNDIRAVKKKKKFFLDLVENKREIIPCMIEIQSQSIFAWINFNLTNVYTEKRKRLET